ncbi:MAG: D-alanyl-D-alanine carboxypeptidase [Phyllobacteriaceae bacterium]|nr:D-alanyl-D-alanine carboxypeptidase [Phyllobacteriaceae bacterium]
MAVAVAVLASTIASPVQAAKHSAIVIDAATGKAMHADNADALRYPASLTKMMTLYLTFEALSRGKIKKSTRIPVSRHAANQPPSKLGLKPGQTITVEAAIYALATKSANDAACALGEALGGSENRFAGMMTAKARALGMSRTTFRNASGLPNPAQVTTARDMARLGMALRQHFPGYFKVFATRSFTYGKRRMANHNKLLGHVAGVDGIKTGYTRASGYNLVTSAGAGNKRIVAVVLGGKTGRSRDIEMTGLVNAWLPKASGKTTKAAAIAKTAPTIDAVDDAPQDDKVVGLAAEQAAQVARKPAVAKIVPQDKASPKKAQIAKAPRPAANGDPTTTASVPSAGWAIQVASMPDEAQAKAFLAKVRGKAGATLADASAYTVPFDNKGVIYFRARFAGFAGKAAALGACASLKKKSIACYAVENQ